MSITLKARDIVTKALLEASIATPSSPATAFMEQTGLYLLQEFVDTAVLQAFTTITQQRAVFNLTAGKGGPSNPYTFGPGGDWDTGAASRPDVIREANIILANVTPSVEIPLAIITDDMYAAEQIKELQTQLGQFLYYQRTVPLGEVQIWPVPNTAVNQVAIYTDLYIPQFGTLDTSYVCPPGYARYLRLGLAKAMINTFAVPTDIAAAIRADFKDIEDWVKTTNAAADAADLAIDQAFTPNPRGNYNIFSDTGAGGYPG